MMGAVECININVEEDPESVKEAFLKFITKIYSGFKQTQDQDEQVIVNL